MINDQPEFWERSFTEKREMWGLAPAKSAIWAKDFFLAHGVEDVLVPGFGYGRNAALLRENGMKVTGIEISQTAIEIARKHYGDEMVIYHGSVTQMPFDHELYDGIFCYALIHLLDAGEREKLIKDCYAQLSEDGYMIFVVISKEASTYGQGTYLSKDRYELFGGVNMYFYDRVSIQAEFGNAGLIGVIEVTENYPFYLITCQRS